MCLFTHIFYIIWTHKTTKNTQITHKMLQISLECVFRWFRYKRLENKWKMIKFTQLSFSVPGVSQIVKTSPWMFKMNKKSTLVLGKSNLFINSPWMKVYTIWQLLPLKFQNWQNRSLGVIKLEFSQNTLVLFMKIQFGTILNNFWGNYTFSP